MRISAFRAGAPQRIAVALVMAGAAVAPATGAGRADVAASCAAISPREADDIAGVPLTGPDPTSQAGGVCFFTARSVSDDADLRYAIVREADVARSRVYYDALVRTCAGVAPQAARAAECARYATLAKTDKLDAYIASELSPAGTVALDTPPHAFWSGRTVVVRGADFVVEASVRRDGVADRARSVRLATAVLASARAH